MNSPYLIARKWTRTDRSAITDPAGQTQFEVVGRLRRKNALTLADPAGLQVATVCRTGWAVRYQITAGNAQATVSLRGIFRPGYIIDTTTGQLRTRGRISGRDYEVSRGAATVASVRHERSLRGGVAVDIGDGEDAVLLLAAVLVLEWIREERREQAAAG
jgi:uncharacterized protein YxjI